MVLREEVARLKEPGRGGGGRRGGLRGSRPFAVPLVGRSGCCICGRGGGRDARVGGALGRGRGPARGLVVAVLRGGVFLGRHRE